MNIRQGIVAVLNSKKNVVGTGFVVRDNLIVTCAHVLIYAKVSEGDIVQVRFDGQTEILSALVEREELFDIDKDVAFLRLDETPHYAKALSLSSSDGSSGHSFYSYGYASVIGVRGIAARGQIVDTQVYESKNISWIQLRSQEPDRGMSGAPVYDENRRVVIGMISKGKNNSDQDHSERNLATTFAIPAEIIYSVCKEIKPVNVCPYLSLASFSESDAQFFHGRKNLINKLVKNLNRNPRFLAVLGPSGSGKSSVVKAGLIPAIRRGEIPGSQSWEIMVTRPAERPYEQLISCGLIDAQMGLELAVRSWLDKNPEKKRLMLVIDQFEELLTVTPKNECQKFLKDLEKLLDASVKITVVITLRDDFYSRFLNEAPSLGELFVTGLINVPPVLETDELKAMIFAPAHSVGLTFEQGLEDLIISDAEKADHSSEQARSTVLPLLEVALTMLWDKRVDGQLTHKTYQEIGGITGSLARWADDIFHAFDKDDRALVETVFCRLVHLGNEKEHVPDTKRVIPLNKLIDDTGKRNADIVINSLVQARLLSIYGDYQTGEQYIEIIHDALLRGWSKLAVWIEEYRTREERAKEKRRQITIFGLSLGLITMIVLALVAWAQRNEADAQRQIAVNNEIEALRQTDISRSLAYSAYAQTALGKNEQELALAFAIESVKIENAPEQAKSIFGQVAFSPGTRRVIVGIPSGSAFRLAISSDGSMLASASGDGDIQLWDATTGKELRLLGDHGTYDDGIAPLIPGLTFSPDDRLVISAGGEDIRFWDVQTGQLIRKIYIGENLGFNSAAFSKDASRLIWGSIDGRVHFWDMDEGKELSVFDGGHQDSVEGVAINDEKTLAVSGGQDGRVILWDIATGKQLRFFSLQSPSFLGEELSPVFRGVAISPDGKFVVGGTIGGAVEIWDIENGGLVRHFDAGNLISGIRFSPDAKQIIFGGQSAVQIWDVDRAQLVHSLSGHASRIQDVLFSPDGNHAFSASDDGTIRIWDIVSQANYELSGHTSVVSSLTVSSDGKYLLSSSWDGSLRVWEIATGREIKRIKTTSDAHFASASLSADGSLIAAGSSDGIRIYDVDTGDVLREISSIESGLPQGILFSARENTLFATDLYPIGKSGYDSSIYAFDASSGQETHRFFNRGISELLVSMDVSADESYIASINWMPSVIGTAYDAASRVNIWDVANNRKEREFLIYSNNGMAHSVAISPDNRYLYAGTSTGKILVYVFETGELIKTIPAHDRPVMILKTSSDGTLLASTSDDKTVRVWNTESWGEIGVFEFEKSIRSLAFVPGTSRLFGGTDTGEIYSWIVQPNIEETLAWVYQNRFVRTFSCLEREQYLLPIRCDEQGNLSDDQTAQYSESVITSLAEIPSKESLEQPYQLSQVENVFSTTEQQTGLYDGDVEIWSFNAKAGDTVDIVVKSSQFDPYLILKDSDGTVLAVNDDFEPGFSNNAAVSKYKVQKTGTYYVVVDRLLSGNANGGKGTYQVFVSVSNALYVPSITLDAIISGKFGLQWDLNSDGYPRIFIVVRDGVASNAGIIPGDLILKINGVDTQKMTKRQIWNALRGAPGNRLSLDVMHIDSQIDTINMVSGLPPAGDVMKIKSLNVGEKQASSIGSDAQEYWVFQGKQNQKVAILMGGTTYTTLSQMSVWDPNAQTIAETGQLGNDIGYLAFRWNAMIPVLELPEEGSYVIASESNNMTAGETGYTMSVQNLIEQGTLKSGETLTGALSSTDGYLWTFSAKRGQFLNINLDLQDSQVEPLLILLAPDGSILGASGLDGFDKFTDEYNMDKLPDVDQTAGYPVMFDGTYTLILLPYLRENPVHTVGTYTLSFEIERPKNETYLKLGESFNTDLKAGTAKFFLLTGHSGDKIRITVDAENPASNASSYVDAAQMGLLDTVLYVFSPDMEPVIGNRDYGDTTNSQIEFSLPDDGTYYIIVSTEHGFGEGNFSIIAEEIP